MPLDKRFALSISDLGPDANGLGVDIASDAADGSVPSSGSRPRVAEPRRAPKGKEDATLLPVAYLEAFTGLSGRVR